MLKFTFCLALLLSYLICTPVDAIELDSSVCVEELVERLSSYSAVELKNMQRACKELKRWQALLDLTKNSLQDEILKIDNKPFKSHKRYPKGDVFDRSSYCKYFYHAHREGEHGHFHLFVYEPAMKKSISPVAYEDKRHVAHLVAISMDEHGFPKGVFTINQWVTGEAWYSASDTIELIPKFRIQHTQPSYPLNRWLTAFVCAFRSQIEDVLIARDERVLSWAEQNPKKDAYREKSLEVLSSRDISLEQQAYAIDIVLNQKI